MNHLAYFRGVASDMEFSELETLFRIDAIDKHDAAHAQPSLFNYNYKPSMNEQRSMATPRRVVRHKQQSSISTLPSRILMLRFGVRYSEAIVFSKGSRSQAEVEKDEGNQQVGKRRAHKSKSTTQSAIEYQSKLVFGFGVITFA